MSIARVAGAADETLTKVADIQLPCIPSEVPCLGPNNPAAFDISFVDRGTDLLLVTDLSNKAVDVVQASTHTFLFYVAHGVVDGKTVGFTGINLQTLDLAHSGPGGVVTTSPTEAWVGDGDSVVKVIDLLGRKITDAIPTGGTGRADELAYDPRDRLILITNPDEAQAPFVSLISVRTRHVLKRISFKGAVGLEQPSWSAETGKFYVPVPSTDGTPDHSGVAVIDPHAMSLEKVIPTGDCDPAGSSFGPEGLLVLGCTGPTPEVLFLDVRTGQIQRSQVAGGADEVWFNPGDNHFYVTANAYSLTTPAAIAVFDVQRSNEDRGEPGEGRIKVRFDAPLVPTPTASHSIAANSATNQIFVPVLFGDPTDPGCPFGCIAVYAANTTDKDDRRTTDNDEFR
jgi:hypothetical protein